MTEIPVGDTAPNPFTTGVVGASIACNCHRSDAGCPGAVSFQYPATMFLVGASYERQLHRSRFVQQMAEMYDRYAEEARRYLNEQDPATPRPMLEVPGMVVVAANVNGEDENDPRFQVKDEG